MYVMLCNEVAVAAWRPCEIFNGESATFCFGLSESY